MLTTPPIVSDSTEDWGHFYGLTEGGKTVPAHVIIGKNGRERPPTLRDIKAANLKHKPVTLPDGTDVHFIVKSVTSLFKLMAREGLRRFIDTSLMLAQEQIPRGDLSDSQWQSEIKHKAGEKMRDAAQLGTRFHSFMEHPGRDPDQDLFAMVSSGRDSMDKLGLDITGREQSFVCRDHLFGGTADVVFAPWGILDFKTRTGLNTYETDCMQQAAYGVGIYGEGFLDHGIGYSLIASTTNPGEVLVHTWTTEDLCHAWDAFLGLLSIWRYKSNYRG